MSIPSSKAFGLGVQRRDPAAATSPRRICRRKAPAAACSTPRASPSSRACRRLSAPGVHLLRRRQHPARRRRQRHHHGPRRRRHHRRRQMAGRAHRGDVAPGRRNGRPAHRLALHRQHEDAGRRVFAGLSIPASSRSSATIRRDGRRRATSTSPSTRGCAPIIRSRRHCRRPGESPHHRLAQRSTARTGCATSKGAVQRRQLAQDHRRHARTTTPSMVRPR